MRRPKGNVSLEKVNTSFQPSPMEMAASISPSTVATTTSTYRPNTQRISTCVLTKNEKGIVSLYITCLAYIMSVYVCLCT